MAQEPCDGPPDVSSLGRGTPGANGVPDLCAEYLPVPGEPFAMRVTRGAPGRIAALVFSLDSAELDLPHLGGTWYVGLPVGAKLFRFDSEGISPPLLSTPSLQAPCGFQLAMQAMVFDWTAQGGIALSNGLQVTVGSPQGTALVLDPVDSPTGASTVTLSGTGIAAGDTVRVEGGAAVATAVVAADRSFAVSVPLKLDVANALFVRETLAGGGESAPAIAVVVQDSSSPVLFVDFPAPDAELPDPTTHVIGRVSDKLTGAAGLVVEVNGIPAVVDVGVGTNATFDAPDVPLLAGVPTPIEVVARDVLGNESSRHLEVTYAPPTGFALTSVAGDGQSGEVGALLPEPLVVQVVHPDGLPFAGKPVRFRVTRSDGRLTADPLAEGWLELTVLTDSDGRASARWRVGSDAGSGNNRVEVTSAGVAGAAYFCATATARAPFQINSATPGTMRAGVGAPAPEPLRVWVSDARNGAEGVPVTFTVRGGSGSLSDGTTSGAMQLTVPTGVSGHAAVELTLGPAPGANLVDATFPGNAGRPTRFVVDGVGGGGPETSFSGRVLDNSGQPVRDALCRLTYADGTSFETLSDGLGLFELGGLPGGGLADLHVEGATATYVGDTPVGQTFLLPTLHFVPYLVAGAKNGLFGPVLLPRLQVENEVLFDGTGDVVLGIAGIDGFAISVPAETTLTLPDGTVAGPTSPVILSLNQVHIDEIPMPLSDGAAPPFAWTLQPGGTTFDPPLPLAYPNTAGLPAGAVGYFLSFDHDTNRFEIVATGSVTADGGQLVSDPGGGLATAGWGGVCPPYSATGDVERCGETCDVNGEITGAVAEVDAPAQCYPGSIEFRVVGAADSGGVRQLECEESGETEELPPGELVYSYTLLGPGLDEQGVGQTVVLDPPEPGTYTCEFTVSSTRPCAPPAVALEPVSVKSVEPVFDTIDPDDMDYGFDFDSPGGPYKSVALGDFDIFDVYTFPESGKLDVHLSSSDPAIATVSPDHFVELEQLASVIGESVGRAKVRAHVGSATAPVCQEITAIVYEPKHLSVALILVHEDNDDVQMVPVGQSAPGAVCVDAGENLFLDSSPLGDDEADPINGWITTGPNGICDTPADAEDRLATDVGSAASVEEYLNDVLGQAVVSSSVSKLPPMSVNYDFDLDLTLDGDGAFTAEAHAIIDSAEGVEPFDHVVFITGHIFAPDEQYLGFTAKGSKWAFVHGGHGAPGDVNHTIAHELGHAAGRLDHDTDPFNLMLRTGDGGIELREYQWEMFHQ